MISLLLAATVSCSKVGEEERGAAVQVAAPVEVRLDGTAPEVNRLLKGLLDEAVSDPGSGIRRAQLGMAYEVNGLPNAAFTSYQQAEALDPGDARWPYFQALIHSSRGELALALQALDRSIAIDATYTAAWLWRGTWALDLGLPAAADEAFLKADVLGGGTAAILGQARVSLHRRQPDHAIGLLEPLSRETGHPGVFQMLGRAYRQAGRIDDARIALARGRSAARFHWEDTWHASKGVYEVSFNARAGKALGMLDRGEAEAALEMLQLLAEEQPDNPTITANLSVAYRRVGEQEKAFWILRRALEEHPDHYPLHYHIADFYRARGDFDTALTHVDRAIAINPTIAALYTRKGLLLRQQNRRRDALAAFESALSYDMTNPLVFLYAGQVEATLNRWPEAIQRFQASVRLDPTFTMGHVGLVHSLARSGRYAESHEALRRARQLGTHKQQVEAAYRQLAELEGSTRR